MVAAQAASMPLFGYALCLTDDEQGITAMGYSPVGGGISISGPAIMAGMLLPALARSREEARKAVCKSNMKQIGLAIAMYQNDFDERNPKELADLHDQYITAVKIFRCPSDKSPRALNDHIKCSYVYVGNLPPTVSPQTIIAYCRKGIHQRGRNVLCYDGHVEWIPNGRLPARLQESLRLVRRARPRPDDPKFDRRVEAFYGDRPLVP